jgi:hypothetical protein
LPFENPKDAARVNSPSLVEPKAEVGVLYS